MSFPWSHLNFWTSGECQVCMEKLDDLQKTRTLFTPTRRDMFKALSGVKADEVKVCIVGQDPYPGHNHATGIAFAIPVGIPSGNHPPTLHSILTEYHDDLGYPYPEDGSLQKWIDQGVLLWNAVPLCIPGKTLGGDWEEWKYLTKEIIEDLSSRIVVFVFLGGVAREFVRYVDTSISAVIETSHPSPRGSLNAKTPFKGSRIFSTINDKLIGLGHSPISWRLE
jgi:uracil-DNA glycosylase